MLQRAVLIQPFFSNRIAHRSTARNGCKSAVVSVSATGSAGEGLMSQFPTRTVPTVRSRSAISTFSHARLNRIALNHTLTLAAGLLALSCLALPSQAQIPQLRAKNRNPLLNRRMQARIPEIAAANLLPVHRPIEKILVKLRPNVAPAAFAHSFSVAFLKTPARAALEMDAAPGKAGLLPLSYIRSQQTSNWHLYRIPSGEALGATLDALRARPEVLCAEPDYHVKVESIAPPNDYYWGVQDQEHLIVVLSGLDTINTAADDDSSYWHYTWGLETVNALGAWNTYPGHYHTAAERKTLLATSPSHLPLVAVIDTGVDFTHPDFSYTGNPKKGHTDTNVANGGQISYSLGRRFIASLEVDPANPDPNPALSKDDYGHGTSVAGVIGAAPNNSKRGIPGLGFPAQIVPIKVIDANGNGDDSDVQDAIDYAVKAKCLLINTSLALDTTDFPYSLADAVTRAWNAGTLVISAAGNDATTANPALGLTRRYPASLVYALGVAASSYGGDGTAGEALASYSNHGYSLGVTAPGGDVTTFANTSPNGADFGLDPIQEYVLIWTLAPTYKVTLSDPNQPDGAYAALGLYGLNYGAVPGTSFACPHVTGLAALYAAKNGISQATPGAPGKILQAIERGAAKLNTRADGGFDPTFGWGRIDASATLKDLNARNSTVGGIIGQVYYGATVLHNAKITAVRVGTTKAYTLSTYPDGVFHLTNLPAGTYSIKAQAFKSTKTITNVVVTAGCDNHGVIFKF